MIILGLTGSIGMGKSTAANQFKQLGIAVHDADAQVHEFFTPDHKAYFDITAAFPLHTYPQIYKKSGAGPKRIDRGALGAVIFGNAAERKRLEAVLHPKVRAAQDDFMRAQKLLGADIVVLDIPLLYETGAESRVDKVVVVTAPQHIQRARVMERVGMSEDRFQSILASQMDNAEKCDKADFIVHTNMGLDESLFQIKSILRELRG